tara:strand:+ start:320 stop:607 length:288 start_codon:yes stop_codon:yes gene_type:complete
MINVVEIYTNKTNAKTSLRRDEIVSGEKYNLKEVFLNPSKIVSLSEWVPPDNAIMPEGLNEEQVYTQIQVSVGMHGKALTVVARPIDIAKKISDG